MEKMTAKQKRFCDEYLIDLNATQAAIRAGYSEKNADKIGSELLGKTRVSTYIKKRIEDRIKRTEVTQDFVIRELMEIASVKATDYARVIEKEATITTESGVIQLYDAKGNPVKYKTVEPILTDELTETQKKALAVIKKGRDGFEIKPYDKLRALELLGKHLGMWTEKMELDADMELNINIDYGEE